MNRVPPSDIETEQSILAACMMGNHEDIIELLSPLNFYSTAHQLIFDAVINIHKAGMIPDCPSIFMHLNGNQKLEDAGGGTYLSTILDVVPLPLNIGKYCEKLKQLSAMRKLMNVCMTTISAASMAVDPEAILDTAQKEINRIEIGTSCGSAISIKDVCETINDDIQEKYKNPRDITGVKSGFDRLDHTLHGFQPSDFIILAARPSIGKTAFALNVAKNSGVPTAIFSLEMSKLQLGYRLLAQKSKISMTSLQTGRVSPNQFNLITDSLGQLYETQIYIDDTAGINLNEFKRRLRMLKKDFGIQLAIIDYLQLMATNVRATRDREIAEVSAGIKSTAKETDIPIITLSQLNRGLEARTNKRPILSDLRDSGTLEQDADVVLFLYRPEPYVEKKFENGKMTEEYEKAINKAELNIAKHRNGKTGVCYLHWEPESTCFFNQTYEQGV